MELYSRVDRTSDRSAVLEYCGQCLRFLFKNPKVGLFGDLTYVGVRFHVNRECDGCMGYQEPVVGCGRSS